MENLINGRHYKLYVQTRNYIDASSQEIIYKNFISSMITQNDAGRLSMYSSIRIDRERSIWYEHSRKTELYSEFSESNKETNGC